MALCNAPFMIRTCFASTSSLNVENFRSPHPLAIFTIVSLRVCRSFIARDVTSTMTVFYRTSVSACTTADKCSALVDDQHDARHVAKSPPDCKTRSRIIKHRDRSRELTSPGGRRLERARNSLARNIGMFPSTSAKWKHDVTQVSKRFGSK